MRSGWLSVLTKVAGPRKIGWAILAGCWLLPGSLPAADLTATLDRDTVSVGESATLTLTLEGGSPKDTPVPPSIPHLRIGYGGQSSQYSWVNGQSSSTVTYTYSLAPTQPGDFSIPPFEVAVGSETLRSPPLLLKAVRSAAAAPDTAGADQHLALLKLVVPRNQLYLGEVVPIELQLYVRDTVQNISQFQSSPFNAEGFTFGKTVQGQRRQVRIGNASFLLIPFTTTLTPVKTGPLTLNPVDCTMVLELPGSQRQRDPFDPFGLFNRNEARRITLSTEPETVQVLPLPEGAPDGFNGAVGNFSMAMSATPTNVAAGDPITVKIQIAGRGALEALTLPDQAAWQDFKFYPPTTRVETTDDLGLQGVKNFELVVVPQSSEVNELPPISFSFFDPEQKIYRTLARPAVPLVVRPGAASLIPTIAAAGRTDNELLKQDIVPIKQRPGARTRPGPALIQRPTFWLVQGVPVLAWTALLVRRKRAEALARNPRLRRRRAVAALIANGLEDLRQLAEDNDSDDFFATLFHLLQEQLGERLDAPASSITESVIDERLRPLGVAEPTLNRLQDLFQACNQARYAPARSSQELAAFIPRLESTLREIQESK
jgi:hypothetical protein